MFEQYSEIKSQYPDCILFYRIGDFYEMFFQDAISASEILDITLTKKRNGAGDEGVPLCGVPYHAADSYLARLLAAGRKVAVCDQVEDPAFAKGLVRREVTRVITPGTRTGDLMLEPGRSNYLASVWTAAGVCGLAYTDISTGEVEAMEIPGEAGHTAAGLLKELTRIEASEIIVSGFGEGEGGFDGGAGGFGDGAGEGFGGGGAGTAGGAVRDIAERIAGETGAMVSLRPAGDFCSGDIAAASSGGDGAYAAYGAGLPRAAVPAALSPADADAPQDNPFDLVRCALAGLFSYLRYTQKRELADLSDFSLHRHYDRMLLDKTAIRNLELTETMFDREVKGSLLGVLDKTRTAMGARLLKKWIREPLLRKDEIDARLGAVDWLLEQVFVRNDVRTELKAVYDIERLCGRIGAESANGRDILALRRSLDAVPALAAAAMDSGSLLLRKIAEGLGDFSAICGKIDAALLDEQPLSVRDGVMIRDGYSEELDGLKAGISDGRQYIADLEGTERERTGIKNLKVRYNRVQGYYIEVSRSNLSLVPEDYMRKQTLVNAERYVTPELKKHEYTVLSAETQINLCEYEIFSALRGEVADQIFEIRRAGAALAQLDVLCSLAEAAQQNRYVKPVISEDERLLIVRGRHPVIEQMLSGRRGNFVPNDISMDLACESMLLLTGPNMAGKSTFMRQTALIVLMAQMGSFVPADDAHIGVCDRIFTRIGASDNLAREESTFLVEMRELSYIIHEYSARSLIILDEIGRGTSTYDGLAIAWASLDYLCAEGRRARCLFATHYHELTALEGVLKGLKNLSTAVEDEGGDVVYLHKIISGASSRSYGIHVAQMAGLPQELLEDAQSKLNALESEEVDVRVAAPGRGAGQISLFEYGACPGSGGGNVGGIGSGMGSPPEPPESPRPRGEEQAAARQSAFDTDNALLLRTLRDVDVYELTPAAAIAMIEKLKKLAEEVDHG
jgi:DNA mismatch repair protein MutS